MRISGSYGNYMLLLAVFVSSSIGATLVNKYVLSVLKFTYPTVYQSWQVGMIFGVLTTTSSFGFIQLATFDWHLFKQWLPAMCFFTLGIYSGSIALSRLSIPVFFSMFHIVYILTSLIEEFVFKKIHSSLAVFGLVLGSIGLLFTIKNDSMFDLVGCKWMLIHCASSASYSVFAKNVHKSPLRDADKVQFNSSFSLLALLCVGTLSGEVGRSIQFPFLYYKKFHAGCIASGIFGALLGMSYSGLRETMSVAKLRFISSASIVLISLLSLALFEFIFSVNLALSVAVCLSGSLIFTYSVMETQTETKIDMKTMDDSSTNKVIL